MAKKIPYLVTKQSFVNELGAIKNSLKRSKERELPPDYLPVSHEAVKELQDRMFVRQIKLVSDYQDELFEASADYLRCMSEKCRLSEGGEILKKDWLDFDAGLKDRWKQIFRQKKRLNPLGMSDRDVGYDIMSTTLRDQGDVKLAGSPITYSYLARGSYHRLSDDLEVGWHPQFEDLLKGLGHA